MTTSDFKNNLYWQLFRVAIQVKHNLMHLADEHGLTVMQLYTLCILEDDSSLPMNSLSSVLYCDASNVTGIVDRLLHQDYIKREENPKDRREKMITLTAKGVSLCKKISHAFLSHELDSLKMVSLSEKETLHHILAKVIQSPDSQ